MTAKKLILCVCCALLSATNAYGGEVLSDRKIKSLLVGPRSKNPNSGWSKTIYFTRGDNPEKYMANFDIHFYRTEKFSDFDDETIKWNGELNSWSGYGNGKRKSAIEGYQDVFRWRVRNGKLIINNEISENFRSKNDCICSVSFSNKFKRLTLSCFGPDAENVRHYGGEWEQ